MTDLERRRRALAPGQEWWEDTPHLLAARIRRERDAGRILEVRRWEVQRGRHAAIVTRLRPGPSRRRVAALWAAGGAVAVSAVGAATWWVATHLAEIVAALLAIAIAAGGLVILMRALGGHRVSCTGLHCPGCRH